MDTKMNAIRAGFRRGTGALVVMSTLIGTTAFADKTNPRLAKCFGNAHVSTLRSTADQVPLYSLCAEPVDPVLLSAFKSNDISLLRKHLRTKMKRVVRVAKRKPSRRPPSRPNYRPPATPTPRATPTPQKPSLVECQTLGEIRMCVSEIKVPICLPYLGCGGGYSIPICINTVDVFKAVASSPTEARNAVLALCASKAKNCSNPSCYEVR